MFGLALLLQILKLKKLSFEIRYSLMRIVFVSYVDTFFRLSS